MSNSLWIWVGLMELYNEGHIEKYLSKSHFMSSPLVLQLLGPLPFGALFFEAMPRNEIKEGYNNS